MGLSLSYSFSVSPPKVLIKLNVFQIMYLIIGVYNTKTEPKNGREIKMKDLNSAEEGDFPCKLQ